MRKFIDIFESEDEWFKANFGTHHLNVDEARRLISSGDISPKNYDMPVLKAGQMLLGLSQDEFGSENFEDSINFLSTATDRKHALQIPDEKFDDPALMVMWNEYQGMRSAYPERKSAWENLDKSSTYPLLIDGNHRLTKKFLMGDNILKTLVITEWDDISKFTYVNGKKLVEDFHEGNTEEPHTLQEALWWVQRWVSGSMDDPDWDDSWTDMTVDTAFKLIKDTFDTSISENKTLYRFLNLSERDFSEMERTMVLPPSPRFNYQSFTLSSEIVGELASEFQRKGSVGCIVECIPNPSDIMFSMRDLKNQRHIYSWIAALADWFWQDEVVVRVTSGLPIKMIRKV